MPKHAEVAAFGGAFLLLVFLNFLFDEEKELHWLGWIEEKVGKYGSEGLAILLTLLAVFGCMSLVPEPSKLPVLIAGVVGVVVYVGVTGSAACSKKEGIGSRRSASLISQGSIGGFLYLEVLDASFSFDGVIGAFAITNDVVIIMLGLAIGAMFVRSLTVFLVHKGTLDEFVYLEHGAHYAIGILALIMFASVEYEIPEWFTGLSGVAFILVSLWSSMRHKRLHHQGPGTAVTGRGTPGLARVPARRQTENNKKSRDFHPDSNGRRCFLISGKLGFLPEINMMKKSLCAVFALAASASLHAQELAVQAGALHVKQQDENTFSAGITYSHPVGEHFALSVSYLNEGHPTDHHRDGMAGQVWVRTGFNQPGWTFGAGAGQYFYFDTTELHGNSTARYTNDHGWAPIYSLQATYHYRNSRWYNQVQVNHIAPHGKDSTTSLMVGVGYQFNGVKGDKLHLDGPSTDDTVTALAGQGISNSLNSERSTIAAIEYRRAVGRYVDWTVTAINEGNTGQTKRNGIATQLWLIRSLNPKVEIGMGAGPYFNALVPDGEGQRSHKAGLVSIASRYHLTRRIVGELSWNRVVTDYHRDADLLLVGLGYSF
jgi:hypothetical protein